MINANTKINMIIGDPVEHSLSPQMHNAGYEALGIDSEFVFIAAHIKPQNLETFVSATKAMNINGVCITIPHKVAVMKFLDEISDEAQIIGAVNTVVNDNGKLIGYNTDWLGVKIPLEQKTELKNKKAAIIGAGGAARAMVYAVQKGGVASATIFNRTLETAQKLADEFESSAEPIEHIEKIQNMDIILNATSIGLNSDKTPIPKNCLTKNQIVFDAVYSPYETQLLQDAQAAGATIIHGTEMLLYQGAEQFKLFTGHNAPIDAMKKELLKTTKIP